MSRIDGQQIDLLPPEQHVEYYRYVLKLLLESGFNGTGPYDRDALTKAALAGAPLPPHPSDRRALGNFVLSKHFTEMMKR